MLPASQHCKGAPWIIRQADLQRDEILRLGGLRQLRRPLPRWVGANSSSWLFCAKRHSPLKRSGSDHFGLKVKELQELTPFRVQCASNICPEGKKDAVRCFRGWHQASGSRSEVWHARCGMSRPCTENLLDQAVEFR